MTELTDLSETDADNILITGANVAEGCPPSGINNAIRNFAGLVRRAFKTSIFRLRDSTDQTKLLAFDLSELTAATTRTLTVPDASGTLPVLGLAQTWTAAQTFPTDTAVDDTAAASMNLSIGGTVRAYLDYTESTQTARLDSDGSLVFAANNVEVARITTDGQFAIGTTGAGTAKLYVINNGTAVRGETSQSGGIVFDTNYSVASGTATFGQWRYNGSACGSISATSAAATSYNTSSDELIKVNFRDFDSGPLIDAVDMYEFEFIDEFGGATAYGFKARATSKIIPTAVTKGKGEPGDEDFIPWSGDYSKLVPIMWKELQSLRRRVAELEAE